MRPFIDPANLADVALPAPYLPAPPIGDIALRRAFSTLAYDTREKWQEAARLKSAVDTLEEQVAEHRHAVAFLAAAMAGSHTNARPPHPPGVICQDGLTLRLRPNQLVSALVAFLTFSIITGLLIAASTRLPELPALSAPAVQRYTPPSATGPAPSLSEGVQ
jgi:hypothetical protein